MSLSSVLDGVSREVTIKSYEVDIEKQTCLLKTEVILSWSGQDGSICLSTSLEDVELDLSEAIETESVIAPEKLYERLNALEEIKWQPLLSESYLAQPMESR